MTNMILFSHGKLANGVADSCQLIIGSHQFKTLNVLLDQPVQEIEDSLDNLIDSFETQEPIIIVTDIPGESTTQTAIKQIEKRDNIYVVTGMNLGLVMSLSFLNLTSNKENNSRVINEAIEETKNGMYLVEDMFNTMDEITDDGDL